MALHGGSDVLRGRPDQLRVGRLSFGHRQGCHRTVDTGLPRVFDGMRRDRQSRSWEALRQSSIANPAGRRLSVLALFALCFLRHLPALLAGMVFWGIGYATQDTLFK